MVEEQTILATSHVFESAFHQRAATMIAVPWTDNGDDHDQDRIVQYGRKAIKQDDTRHFADEKSSTIRVIINRVRLLCDAAAMEDGRASASLNRSAPAINQYLVFRAKVAGKWLVSAVRDVRLAISSTYTQFDDFAWLIGKQVPDKGGTKTDYESCLRTHR